MKTTDREKFLFLVAVIISIGVIVAKIRETRIDSQYEKLVRTRFSILGLDPDDDLIKESAERVRQYVERPEK